MAKVKFSHTVRYNGERIPAHTPFDVKDEELDALKVSGAIILEVTPVISETPVIPPPVDEPQVEGPGDLPDEPDKEDEEIKVPEKVDIAKLAKFSVEKLKEFAKERNIPIPDNGSKPDIFNAISVALR